jgi:integrase
MFKRIGYHRKQTAHGFRHPVSTALNNKGYREDWIERQLAHGDPDEIRGTSNKAQHLEPRRQMMQESRTCQTPCGPAKPTWCP